MKKTFKSILALSAVAVLFSVCSSSFAGDTYRDSRGVVRRSSDNNKPSKPSKPQGGNRAGSSINWDSLNNKETVNDYSNNNKARQDASVKDNNGMVYRFGIVPSYAGDISSVYGNRQAHAPSNFQKKQQGTQSDNHVDKRSNRIYNPSTGKWSYRNLNNLDKKDRDSQGKYIWN